MKRNIVIFLIPCLMFAGYMGWRVYLNKNAVCVCMPMHFSSSGVPIISMDIHGKSYAMEIDLGSKFSMSLNKKMLETIDKKVNGEVFWRDGKGYEHQAMSYLVSKIHISEFEWKDVVVRELEAGHEANTLLWHAQNQQDVYKRIGAIGRPLLEKANLCLDFPGKIGCICNDLHLLQDKQLLPPTLMKVPFKLGKAGIVLQVTTEWGKKNFILDTGCTATLIRNSQMQNQEKYIDWRNIPYCITSHFIIGDHDFGSLEVLLYDIAPQLEDIDGVLGMNFLARHIIYIDYPNRAIYIGREE